MNIYNDSSYSNLPTYPTQINATDIETTNLIVNNSLSLNNLQKGQILIGEDSSSDVGFLDLGLNNNVLCADTTSGLPQWRNFLTVENITTDEIFIPNLIKGDILTCAVNGSVARLPVGANETVLYSNGTECGWLPRNYQNAYNYIAGSLNNISVTPATIIGVNHGSFINGLRYRISFNARILAYTDTILQVYINGVLQNDIGMTYLCQGDVSRSFIWTSNFSGAINFEIYGSCSSGTCSLLNFYLFSELF